MRLFFTAIMLLCTELVWADDVYDGVFKKFIMSDLNAELPVGRMKYAIRRQDIHFQRCVDGELNFIVFDEFSLSEDPMNLVTSFEIENYSVQDNAHIIANVSYQVLYTAYYECDVSQVVSDFRVIKANKTKKHVQYILEKRQNNQWKVVNPPKPYVLCAVYKKRLHDEFDLLHGVYERSKNDKHIISKQLQKLKDQMDFIDCGS